MTIKKTIEKAIEGGWGLNFSDITVCSSPAHDKAKCSKYINDYTQYFSKMGKLEIALLDPSFWQSLSKSMGWGTEKDGDYIKKYAGNYLPMEAWKLRWHRLIDHLASGGTAESYFKELT